MNKYIYATNEYETMSAVETAVTAMKTRLDNNPTDWCVIKSMINPRTIKIYSGDVIGYDSGNALTDAQINALSSSDNVYNIFSINDGDNFTEVTEGDIAEIVNTMRSSYGRWLGVDKYCVIELNDETNELISSTQHNATNEDMSSYV